MSYYYINEILERLRFQHCSFDPRLPIPPDPDRFVSRSKNKDHTINIVSIPGILAIELNKFPPEFIPVINWKLSTDALFPFVIQLYFHKEYEDKNIYAKLIKFIFKIADDGSCKVYNEVLESTSPSSNVYQIVTQNIFSAPTTLFFHPTNYNNAGTRVIHDSFWASVVAFLYKEFFYINK